MNDKPRVARNTPYHLAREMFSLVLWVRLTTVRDKQKIPRTWVFQSLTFVLMLRASKGQ